MKITLKKLVLQNFKGIKNLEVNFSDITNISGDNAKGKTSIFDAFIWLMYGKDSLGRADFNIKTLDKSNKVIHKIEHSVLGIFDIDGSEVVFQKILREKWTKRRGSEIEELTGNETTYFINEVPCAEKDYKSKINSIIDENLFKMLTSVNFFHSMKWQDRREMLIKIAGGIDDAIVAGDNEDFKKLISFLSGKSLDEFRKELASKKKKIKDELELIPSRVDEVRITIPDVEPNYTEIKSEIVTKEKEISNIDDQIADVGKQSAAIFESKLKIQSEINTLKQSIQKIEFDAKQKFTQNNAGNIAEIDSTKFKVQTIKQTISTKENYLKSHQGMIEVNKKQRNQLSDDYDKINESELIFNENEFICPTCKREFDAYDIDTRKEEMTVNFNKDKVEKLEAINNKGVGLNKQNTDLLKLISDLETEITNHKTELLSEESKLNQLLSIETPTFVAPIEIEEIKSKITTLESSIAPTENNTNIPDYKLQKSNIQSEIDTLRKILNKEETVKQSRERIKELDKKSKELAASLASIERTEFIAENFTKARISTVEERINSMFQYAKFKMFEFQINGAEVPTCETLYNGVPYSDLNNAMRINIGLDICNTLSLVNNVSAPIWVDNSESTNEFIPTSLQLIKLIVTKDQKLVIN